MTQVTWLGEDADHENENGPKFNTWNGIKFMKGVPVELDADEHKQMIEKMKQNRFYQVRGPGRPPNSSKEA